jgi:hypothetical protein
MLGYINRLFNFANARINTIESRTAALENRAGGRLKVINEKIDIPTLSPTETILPGQIKNLEVTLKSRPNELLIRNFQWSNMLFREAELSTDSFLFGKRSIKMNEPGQGTLYLNTDTRNKTRLFSIKSKEEMSNNAVVSSEYADEVSTAGVALGYGKQLEPGSTGPDMTTYFVHDNIYNIGSKLAIKDVSVLNNKLIFSIQNQSTLPLTLPSTKIPTPVPVQSKNSSLRINRQMFSTVIGDKILTSGPSFASKTDGSTPVTYRYLSTMYVTSRDGENIQIINDPFLNTILYDNLLQENIADTNFKHSYVMAISGTPKYNNSNEYYVAFIEGTNFNILFYDSASRLWTKKSNNSTYVRETNYTSYNDNPTTGRILSLGNFTNTACYGKKPLDIKDINGSVHGLITSYRNGFDPVVDFTTNIADTPIDFTTFGMTDLINTDYAPSNSDVKFRNFQVHSKIINGSTFYSSFSAYCDSINKGTPSTYNEGPMNFFVKTINSGTDWNHILEGHHEYSMAKSVERFISDDGQTIEVVVVTGPSSNLSTDTFSYNSADAPLYKSYATIYYQRDWVIYNRSTDGGLTWKYTTGYWSIVTKTGALSGDYKDYVGYDNPGNVYKRNDLFIHYDSTINETVIGFKLGNDNSCNYNLIKSTNGGDSWRNIFPYPKHSPDNLSPVAYQGSAVPGGTNLYCYLPNISGEYIPSSTSTGIQPTDSNSLFGCFMIYSNEGGNFTPLNKYGQNIVELSENYENQLGVGGLYNTKYRPGNTNHVFTWEGTNENGRFSKNSPYAPIVNIKDQTKTLSKLPVKTTADTFFSAFFDSYYGSSYYGLASTAPTFYSLFATGGTFDKLKRVEVSYIPA